MTFVFPLMLGGLALVGVPVLVHLIMRQKPRHLLFPAFRFLLERHRTNQRKLQLRHILLLALRITLIAAFCLALARPKVFSERLSLTSDRPIAAVLIFDTSMSMQYTIKGESRLDLAKRRAQELLDDLPEGSRVAVLDTAEPGGEWLPTLSLARERIAGRALRPANNAITSRLSDAYRVFNELDLESGQSSEALLRFVYIFSDRTRDSWDPSRTKDLEQLRERFAGQVKELLVDVGADSPVDVALAAIELARPVVAVDDSLTSRVTVRATGTDCETVVICRIDNEKAADRKPIQLKAGQSKVLTFQRSGLAAGSHQVEIALETTDALPANNAVFATCEVRGSRKILLLVDEPGDAEFFKAALDSSKTFHCEIRTISQAAELSPIDFENYKAVCLLNVAKPSANLWDVLAKYVHSGGGLAIIPGGEELNLESYNRGDSAQALMPGSLVKIVQADKERGATWNYASYSHPIIAPFREWTQNSNISWIKFPPAAFHYWQVEPFRNDSYTVVTYSDKSLSPAVLERIQDRKKIKGRVVLLTTPLDRRHLSDQPWNDYLKTSFYLVLTNRVVAFLAGEAEEAGFNYLAGQTVTIAAPPASRSASYTLQGPGLSQSETTVQRDQGRSELALSQAVTPGNYSLLDAEAKSVAAFSINLPPGESDLTRVPDEQVEALLGPGSILQIGVGQSFREALQGHWSQPVEIFPWLMISLLIALAVENLLANKFYADRPLQTADAAEQT